MKIPKSEYSNIVDLRIEQYWTLQEIANKYCVSKERIRQILGKYDIKGLRDQPDLTAAMEEYHNNETSTFTELGEKYGIHRSTISNLYRKHYTKTPGSYKIRGSIITSIVEEYRTTHNICHVSRKFNVSQDSIRRVLKQYCEEYEPIKMKPKVHLSKKQRRQVVAQYLKGENSKSLAKKYNVNYNTIHKFLREAGWPKQKYTKQITLTNLKRVFEEKKNGLSNVEISRKLKLSKAAGMTAGCLMQRFNNPSCIEDIDSRRLSALIKDEE